VAVSSRHARHLGGLLAVVAHAVGLVGDEQIDARARAQRIAVQRHALIRRHDDEVRVAIVTHGGQLLELELVVQARLARAGEHDGELVLGLAEPALELGLPASRTCGAADSRPPELTTVTKSRCRYKSSYSIFKLKINDMLTRLRLYGGNPQLSRPPTYTSVHSRLSLPRSLEL
jgi:hypothetical protein